MEIILLWLDDLDDLVFGAVHAVERLRWPCLKVGFTAACSLGFVMVTGVRVSWEPVLAGVAFASVLLWVAAVLARERSWVAGSGSRSRISPGT